MVLIGLPIHLVFNMLMALLLNTKIQGPLNLSQHILCAVDHAGGGVDHCLALDIQRAIRHSERISPLHRFVADRLVDRSRTGFKPSLIFMGAWFGGNTILIYLAGLQDVPA